MTFVNQLRPDITVTGGGAQPTTVKGTGAVVFPGGSLTATWTANDEHYTNGAAIPDDLGPTPVSIAAGATITISNVVGTTTYFTPHFTNSSGISVTMAVAHGATVTCLGTILNGNSFTWSYYRLEPAVEIRYYATATCTGAYRYWDAPAISGSMFGGGLVFLEATTPP